MNGYITHPKIKEKKIQTRIYQQIMYAEAIKNNSLIVLPTGLGKTVIMVMIIAHYLNKYPGKVIVTAPTRPLVEQHFKSMNEMINIDPDEIVLLSGSTLPKKRVEIWNTSQLIITTPQTLRNDIISGAIDLQEVSLICFDEVHRAVGDDPYVLCAEQYLRKNTTGRISGFTASPKSKEKLLEIINNLGIKTIKYMDEDDPRVKRYIHGANIEKIWIEMPDEMKETKKEIEEFISFHLQYLKDAGILNSANIKKITKTDIIKLPGILNSMKMNLSDTDFFGGMSSYGQLMLAYQGVEMLETQGINTLNSFFQNKLEENKSKSKSSLRKFLFHPNIQNAIQLVNQQLHKGIKHPKMVKLLEIVEDELNKNPNSKMIIFSNYKATVDFIINELKQVQSVKAHKFVGQASSSYGKGLSQKEQTKVMDNFRSGVYNILVSTSVGEEGLDVAQVDYVMFYDLTPSSTRLIQRSGRTGRFRKGTILFLITKGTKDEFYYYSSQKKKNAIKTAIEELMGQVNITTKEEHNAKIDDYFEPLENKALQHKNSHVKSESKKDDVDKGVVFPKDQTKPLIYVDYREKSSNLLRELLNREIELKQADLPIADFIVSDQVGIERKTIKDFCSSIIDNRLFEQLTELKRTFIKPILILEGDSKEQCNLRKSSFAGAISSIIIDFGIPILQVQDVKETCDYLYMIAKREQLTSKRKVRIRAKSNYSSIQDDQLHLISSLPNINGILADKLLQHFKTPKAIFTAHPDILRKVHGIGKNISDTIDQILTKPFNDEVL